MARVDQKNAAAHLVVAGVNNGDDANGSSSSSESSSDSSSSDSGNILMHFCQIAKLRIFFVFQLKMHDMCNYYIFYHSASLWKQKIELGFVFYYINELVLFTAHPTVRSLY